MRLTVTGPVERFAVVTPPKVALRGDAGDPLQETVTITPEAKYPFKIVAAHSKNDADFTYVLEEETGAAKPGYRLTVSNRRTQEGRYSDTIFLDTDSPLQPRIEIRVIGHIKKPEIALVVPPRVFLEGPAGSPLGASVRVAPKEGQTFQITAATADNGANIRVTLKEDREGDQTVYRIAVENNKKEKGRYQDTIRLKTTSDIQPEITVPVTGKIL